jgi:hypothetical protein
MEPLTPEVPQPKRGFKQILKSYFFWTYPRGCFHYDVMVTLILLFIFVTPWLWNYGAKQSLHEGPQHPIQVVNSGDHSLIITVQAADVSVELNTTASYQVVKKALRKAIEPVTGDAVSVERWETGTDSQGNSVWRVWAHK